MKPLRTLKYSHLIKRFLIDPAFHNQHRSQVIDWSRGVISHNLKQGFYVNIDQYQLQKYTNKQREKIIKCFPQQQIRRIEMVGSTAIPGMCGMFSPDFGIYVRQFPPSDTVFQKLQQVGYQLAGFYNIGEQEFDNLWLFKKFEQWETHNEDEEKKEIIAGASIHIWKQGSGTAQKMIDFRDLATEDKSVFQDYKRKKIQMMSNEVVGKDKFIDYKKQKGKVASKALTNSNQKQSQ